MKEGLDPMTNTGFMKKGLEADKHRIYEGLDPNQHRIFEGRTRS